MVRVGINGLGVMGRYLIRAREKEIKDGRLHENDIEIVAFNDLYPAEQLAPLLMHDSVYLRFDGDVKASGKDIVVNGKILDGSLESNPQKLRWGDRGVDIVYESSGAYAKKPGVEGHLEAGAKGVVFSAPSNFAKKTIVMGVNDEDYQGEDIVSAASCTTNCLAPLALALYKEFGPYKGLMTTIHAYTADQRLIDSPHKDVARGYAAGINMIPTTTGAAKVIGKVIPELDKQMDGMAIRVPVPSGSLVDLTVGFEKEVGREEINEAVKKAADTYLKGILDYRGGPLVSTMILGDPIPSIFDASQTKTIGNLAKVFAWYDNVAGYSHQAIKLIRFVGEF